MDLKTPGLYNNSEKNDVYFGQQRNLLRKIKSDQILAVFESKNLSSQYQ